ARRRRAPSYWLFSAFLYGSFSHRGNRRLHAATLGGVPHDFRDRGANSNRNPSFVASPGFGWSALSAGELFHCLVFVSRAEARQAQSACHTAARTGGDTLGTGL